MFSRGRRPRRRRPTPTAAIVVLAGLATLAGCGGGTVAPVARTASIKLRSSAFTGGARIPARYTCDGADVAPPLSWSGLPRGTAQLAITLEDVDAPGGSFTHWAAIGLSPGSQGIGEGERPAGVVEGRNDFGRSGYGGPCPPHGRRHRYRFVLYALRSPLALSPGFRLSDAGTDLAKDTLAVGELIGVYGR